MILLLLQLMVYCQSQCPFGFDSVTSNPIRRLQENEPPTSEPSSQPFITAESTAQRKESPATSQFLDTSALTNCKEGFCVPPADNGYIGGYFYTSDGANSSNSVRSICIDVLPNVQANEMYNQSFAQSVCLQLAAEERACEKEEFLNGTYCARSCGICEQPIWSDGVDGSYSGPNQLLKNGLYNSSRFLNVKIPRVKCTYYDPNEVADAIRSWAGTNPPNLDLPKLNRLAFHDAADYNKWTGTGGPDGNLVMGQEMFYGQSHNLPLKAKSSLAQFKEQFGERLSWADLIQIAGMVATELAGGPVFADYEFEPGRRDNFEGTVSLDGLLPNAGELANINTNRDFWFRAGFDEVEFTASMGAHTLGINTCFTLQISLTLTLLPPLTGGSARGDFTSTPNSFNNEYFINLLVYGAIIDNNCCQQTNGGGFIQLSTDRALLQDANTKALVEMYANNQSKWFEDYVFSIRKMSLFGKDVSVGWCDY